MISTQSFKLEYTHIRLISSSGNKFLIMIKYDSLGDQMKYLFESPSVDIIEIRYLNRGKIVKCIKCQEYINTKFF